MDISELKEKFAEYSNPVKTHPNFLFRGQSDKKWDLTPSLTRIARRNKLDRDKCIQLERESISKFSISANYILPIEQTLSLAHVRLRSQDGLGIDFLGWQTLMQHFSAPTRLLDWTSSIWVALYFACAENAECDGVIYIADFNKVTNHSDKKLNGGNLTKLMGDPKSSNIVVFLMAYNSNERIEAQQGRFSVCTNPLINHDKLINESDPNSLIKFEIPKEIKTTILMELNQMNINAKTLFPGIDGLGKSIYEYCHLWDRGSIIK